MSIATFVDMRDAAVEQIKAAVADPKIQIAAHPGVFNEAEIKRLAQRTPAVLTSFMRYNGEDKTITFVSWVVYRATSKDALYNGALRIVSALIPILEEIDAEWSLGGGQNIEAECLYSGTLDTLNATLWGVKWEWRIRDSVLADGEGGVPLADDLEIFEGYDAETKIGNASAHDIVNLEG